jgi:hypothetical protein
LLHHLLSLGLLLFLFPQPSLLASQAWRHHWPDGFGWEGHYCRSTLWWLLRCRWWLLWRWS